MKKSAAVLIALCGTIACALVFLNKTRTSAPAMDNEASKPAALAPEKLSAPKMEAAPSTPVEIAPVPVSSVAVTNNAKPDDSESPNRKSVDALLSARSAGEKHELFQSLVKSGQIDAAIAELKQRAADNPNNPEIPTTLGEAQLNKLRALHDAGGDLNDQGILAMQADQSFNAALKIDPANYEAQLVKSIAQTFWPADPARDGQVVQTLSGLIDRQETMTPQPAFAQTYLYLGNEYQKIGQPDKAQATWQLGLQKFPNDPALQQKISGP